MCLECSGSTEEECLTDSRALAWLLEEGLPLSLEEQIGAGQTGVGESMPKGLNSSCEGTKARDSGMEVIQKNWTGSLWVHGGRCVRRGIATEVGHNGL